MHTASNGRNEGSENKRELPLPVRPADNPLPFRSDDPFINNPEDDAAVRIRPDGDGGFRIEYTVPPDFGEEAELMLRLLVQHLSTAILRFKESRADKESLALALPDLDRDSLTRRECETLPHLLHGKSNSEIASILGISPRTAEKHVASILDKSGAENRKTLISEAKYRSA